MDPLLLLLGFLALKGRKPSAASSPPPALNGAGENGSHVPAITLHAGRAYRFVGTLAPDAPKPEQIKQLLRMVAGTAIKLRGDAVSFTVRLPMDVPFAAGSVHPKAPWLRLDSATEVKPGK